MKTHSKFVEEMSLVDKTITVLGEYKRDNESILVDTKYGKAYMKPTHLLRGKYPSIRAALDKGDYLKRQYEERYGKSNYDYSKVHDEYTYTENKVTLKCNIHGEFKISPNSHVSKGQGCQKCSIKKLIEKLPGNYSVKNAEKYKEQWILKQAIVYFIKCWNENEVFYKVGITTKDIKWRFRSKAIIPYRWELIREINTNLYDAVYLEKEIHNNNKAFRYTPIIFFNGHTECFSKII